MQRLLLLCVLCWGLFPGGLLAQERWVKGRVVKVVEHSAKIPEVNVTVTLVETGDTDNTNTQGVFRIYLPKIFKAGEKVTFMVDKPDWVIQYPLEGEARVPADLQKDLVEVRLLPVGSKLLWTDDRIEKLIQDLAEKSKQQVTRDGRPEQIDFSRYIKDWAVKYGFSAQQAREEIDKWIAETEADQKDSYKRGLAAFAKKNFGEASQLFHDSAEYKAKKLAEMQQQQKNLTEEVIRDYRLEGEAHYNNYVFEKALDAYQRALSFISQEHTPQLFAETLMDIGKTHWEIGIRTAGLAIQQHLSAAAKAFHQTLQVYTRADLPQQWAMTQNNLGIVLQEQGLRTGGAQGVQLLAEAVAAYQRALEVQTRADLPQQWAMTQNNLGNALQEQGLRTGGAQGVQLLADAVAAYQRALEVYTWADLPQQWATTQNNLGTALQEQGNRTGRAQGVQLLAEAVAAFQRALEVRTLEALPPQWAQTQNNLAAAYVHLKDWPNAAASYANVLKVYPDYEKAYSTASYLYHEILFKFPEAFALNQTWVEWYPKELSALSEYAEKHFTTSQFAECAKRLAALLADPAVEARVKIALRIIEIANLLALNNTALVPGKIETLLGSIAEQPEDFKVDWTIEGIKYFISHTETLAPHRPWLLQFFSAVAGENRRAVLTALQEAQASFRVAMR